MRFALVILLATVPLGAQGQTGFPPVLRIFREDVKEGKAAAHEKTEAAFMQAAAKAKYPAHILGMASMTGTSQALFLEGHDNIASIADSQDVMDTAEFGAIDAADAQVRINQRSMLAVYRPDLSYRADKINLPKTRFFSIETVLVRESSLQTYADLVKMILDAAKKSADTQSVATYEVVSGAPNFTFLVMEPRESLKSLDEELQHDPAFFQAMGAEGLKRYAEASSQAVVSSESLLYAVNPQMSYVPQEWITTDPAFWTPKPAEISKPPVNPSPKVKKKPATK
jgi:hypothetical protein